MPCLPLSSRGMKSHAGEVTWKQNSAKGWLASKKKKLIKSSWKNHFFIFLLWRPKERMLTIVPIGSITIKYLINIHYLQWPKPRPHGNPCNFSTGFEYVVGTCCTIYCRWTVMLDEKKPVNHQLLMMRCLSIYQIHFFLPQLTNQFERVLFIISPFFMNIHCKLLFCLNLLFYCSSMFACCLVKFPRAPLPSVQQRTCVLLTTRLLIWSFELENSVHA